MYDAWLERGARVRLNVPAFGPAFAKGETLDLFAVDAGNKVGPHLTFLHGFPTSSYDFQPIFDLLSGTHHLLAFDFVGFGDSEKPRTAAYSIHAQADLVEAMWQHFHVDRTVVVAHDYGVSVAQELLARRSTDNMKGLAGITFLNGGLYPDLHRPLPVQRALRTPVIGWLTTWLASERMFHKSMRNVFSKEHAPSDAALHEHWRAIERRSGHRMYDKLIHYLRDRETHAERWRAALELNAIPKQFLWGMLDPVSGPAMTERLKERIRPLRLVEMHDVGHYPQLEAPKRVADLVAEWFPTR
ncbi:MAG: alpha/beta hydrolase [Deltaproteobacteria bacterium]|nr:alpha/beta hydrolase [Deltaproteobacteria bacterium]